LTFFSHAKWQVTRALLLSIVATRTIDKAAAHAQLSKWQGTI